MKSIKQGLAVFLAVLLMAQPMSALAEETAVAAIAEVPIAEVSEAESGEETEVQDAGVQNEGTSVENGTEDEMPEVEESPVETPEVEESPVETTDTEETSSEAPSVETPSTETPSAEVPSAETPSTETPSAEIPSTEEVPPQEPTIEMPTISPSVEAPTEEPSSTETPSVEEPSAVASAEETTAGTETLETETETETMTETETETMTETETEKKTVADEEVSFNTGNCVFSIVNKSDFEEHELGDGYFEEDGSYTIQIPEENPFFPYEVQFTYEGETSNHWFMTPDDSVEIGGHTFYVSAYFDGTVVTQMNLKVGDNVIVAYPERKEFTDGDGAMPLSLLPLEERRIRVDLSGYTPVELTMVSTDSLFAGDQKLEDTDNVIWKYGYSDEDYEISTSGDYLDLSRSTYYGDSELWEMIVGECDQLASGNIRYLVNVKTTGSLYWLKTTLFTQETDGTRTEVKVGRSEYRDYDGGADRNLYIASGYVETGKPVYAKLEINSDVFGNVGFDHWKFYEGAHTSVENAMAAADITDKISSADMTQADAGYQLEKYWDKGITMVAFDASGNVRGCLPFWLDWSSSGNTMRVSLFAREADNREYVVDYYSQRTEGEIHTYTLTLYSDYAADANYYLDMTFTQNGTENASAVTAAYEGKYSSIAEAASAGAVNIKDMLFNYDYEDGGYAADYSKGVNFTVFIGEDGNADQEIWNCIVKTEEGTNEKEEDPLSSTTAVSFYGLRDASGKYVECYGVETDEDSYAEYNYLSILVGENTDLSNLAPQFSTGSGVKLYAAGSSTPEVSGKSVHDFSNGPVQYTASAEDGKHAKNYWLQVVKVKPGAGWLYVNSLADAESETRTEGGITYSTREILLDGYHDYRHDILLANMGTEELANLSVELVSDTVSLDDYWTLSGNHGLSGCITLDNNTSYGELPNLAKIRLRAASVEDGTDVSGTLTIKSAGNVIMVINLTGIVGDPSIITKEIPQAVKYVPYGTMIQNSNKYYSWNKVSYRLLNGNLPEGMIVKENGEIYGVPKEAGEFKFTVLMENSGDDFKSSTMTYTLTVLENTDPNVESATDSGYELTQRVPDIRFDTSTSPTVVSQGEFGEFVDIYLDGVKLDKSSYNAQSGSTRITISIQTMMAANTPGTHTLGIEFRTKDNDTLKRAAQNYVYIGKDGDSGNQGGGDHEDNDSGSSDGGSGDSSNAGTDSVPADVNTANKPQNIGTAPEITVSGNEVQPTIPVTGVTAGERISYTVQEGDSLWKIAEKYFGSGVYWELIFKANAAAISNPDKIFAGQVLVLDLSQISDASGLQQLPNEDAVYYTVERGDTLWKIAQKFYGQGWRWRKIVKANPSIGDENQIYEGQIIVIP